jgi:hypothetical protein
MRYKPSIPSLFFCLLPVFLSLPAFGQDARSLGMGLCGSGLDWGPTALIWNPAALQFSIPESGWALSTGGTAFDSTNTGGSALDYNMDEAAQSTADPIKKRQSYQGLAALQMRSMAGGLLYDQESTTSFSQGAADFFSDRSKSALHDSYGLNDSSREERIETLALGYAQNIPLGQMSAALGGTLKIHQGSRFRQTSMDGIFTKGADGGYSYQQWSAKSGSGFSWDGGILFKPTATIQVGVLLANINSNYKWKAERTELSLDPLTGAQSVVNSYSETVQSNRPRVTRTGITLHNEDKTSLLTAEAVHQEGETVWHFGFERILPAQHLAMRLGTFRDLTCDQRLWTGGIGYYGRSYEVDLGAATRKIPVLQDSAGFGFGLSFSMVL